MTTDTTIQAQPADAAPACKFDGRHRRKFRRACCCITFLLLLNALLLLHTSQSIGAIVWFMMNGSYTHNDTTYLYIPGGAKTLCNDLCVDMCIYNKVNCELNSCLNLCNQQLIEDGNQDDFQPLPQSEHPMILDDIHYEEPIDYIDDNSETPLILVDTPPEPEPMTSMDDSQQQLNVMKNKIEAVAEALTQLKEGYNAKCGENVDVIGCNVSKAAIMKTIQVLKEMIAQYDTYAVSVQVDIKVSVWMIDMDDVMAQP